ncbi:hypothetical protein JXA34_01355 [Patescibacteria group bacterium]|nr:hypothetical protein [Patescibacteria group bacterium]
MKGTVTVTDVKLEKGEPKSFKLNGKRVEVNIVILLVPGRLWFAIVLNGVTYDLKQEAEGTWTLTEEGPLSRRRE